MPRCCGRFTVADQLNSHIRIDDERNADSHPARALQFNNELLREIQHTREDFIEILAVIDAYETTATTIDSTEK